MQVHDQPFQGDTDGVPSQLSAWSAAGGAPVGTFRSGRSAAERLFHRLGHAAHPPTLPARGHPSELSQVSARTTAWPGPVLPGRAAPPPGPSWLADGEGYGSRPVLPLLITI